MIWDSENDRGSDCVLKATFSSPSGFRNRQNMARIGCELAITTIALVLLAAAALKINSLSTRAAMGITGAKSGLELAAVLGEVLLATWLISGFARNWARASGVLLFAVFSIISLKHWIAGDLNCGCFGEVTVHPAWTTGFDIVAVLTLIKFGRRPIRDDGNVTASGLLSYLITTAHTA